MSKETTNDVENKKIVYINPETTDYSIVYYSFDIYTKINCLLNYYYTSNNIFEADEIMYGIYLGNINSVYDIKKLKELGITNIISVIAGFIPPFPEDFNYLVVNALDNENTNLFNDFDKINDYIDNLFYDYRKILIHCQAGRSRSTTILAAYFIKKFGLSASTSLDIIQNKRNIVQPNKYFMSQLEKYEIKCNLHIYDDLEL